MQNTHIGTNGWGIDASQDDRPGVPKETLPPAPVGNASWLSLEPQAEGKMAVRDASRPVTPVYSTCNPPRGLSGVIRRAAYRVPDYKPRRWMMLLLADRVDVIEHSLVPVALLFGGLAALLGGAYAVKRWRDA